MSAFKFVSSLFLGFAFSLQASAASRKCEPVPLSTDGGSYTISYKYVNAQVAAKDLVRVINDLSEIGTKGIALDNEQMTRCTAVIHLDQMSERNSAGTHALRLRVVGNCENGGDFRTVNRAETSLMRSMIEDLAQIPQLKVDPSWDAQPPCLGTGGVTGSN